MCWTNCDAEHYPLSLLVEEISNPASINVELETLRWVDSAFFAPASSLQLLFLRARFCLCDLQVRKLLGLAHKYQCPLEREDNYIYLTSSYI